MITGAASADAAILLIDAQRRRAGTIARRHAYLLSLLGIWQIVVVLVNKMDLVGYEKPFSIGKEREYREFLVRLGVKREFLFQHLRNRARTSRKKAIRNGMVHGRIGD